MKKQMKSFVFLLVIISFLGHFAQVSKAATCAKATCSVDTCSNPGPAATVVAGPRGEAVFRIRRVVTRAYRRGTYEGGCRECDGIVFTEDDGSKVCILHWTTMNVIYKRLKLYGYYYANITTINDTMPIYASTASQILGYNEPCEVKFPTAGAECARIPA